MRSVVVLSLLLIFQVVWSTLTPSISYDNSVILSNSPLVELRWSVDHGKLEVAVTAETPEWVLISFSSDASIEGNDGIVAEIDSNGEAHVIDYYAPTDNSCPEMLCTDHSLGCQNDIQRVSEQMEGNIILVEFARPLKASDECDRQFHGMEYVHWAVGSGKVSGASVQTVQFKALKSTHKRSPTVEMIVLGGRTIFDDLGNWFGHQTLEYWTNVDGATVQLDQDYSRENFCASNPSAVQIAATELVTMDGYSIWVPKQKYTIRGVTIDWKVEDVQVSAGYCTAPTTSTVACAQHNTDLYPEAATDFIPLVINTESLADTWEDICEFSSNYDYVEQCTPSACKDVRVTHWTNSKYPDLADTIAAGWAAIRENWESVEGQTNSNTYIREHVRAVFGREIVDLEPGGRDYPGNVYPIDVIDIWCGNKPWRTDIDPTPPVKPCGSIKMSTTTITTSSAVTTNNLTSTVATYTGANQEFIQAFTKSTDSGYEHDITILDTGFASGRTLLTVLKIALERNPFALEPFGILGNTTVGELKYVTVEVAEENVPGGAATLGISGLSILLLALIAF